MNRSFELNPATKVLIYIVIIVHITFFILEAVLWMNPFVHNQLLDLLNNPVTLAYPVQTLVLKNLFINQGFYNLFLVIGGIAGLYQIKKRNYAAGYALILFLCFAGTGAGIILALSTKAYLFAFLQTTPAAITFFRIYPLFRQLTRL